MIFEWHRQRMCAKKTASKPDAKTGVRTGGLIGKPIAVPMPAGKCVGWIVPIRLPVNMANRGVTMHARLRWNDRHVRSGLNRGNGRNVRSVHSARSERNGRGGTSHGCQRSVAGMGEGSRCRRLI